MQKSYCRYVRPALLTAVRDSVICELPSNEKRSIFLRLANEAIFDRNIYQIFVKDLTTNTLEQNSFNYI